MISTKKQVNSKRDFVVVSAFPTKHSIRPVIFNFISKKGVDN